ncbi:MAG: apolipoprotein N-acyltransferase [Treponema sp.]|nr:apolipoprotein N-acyltransferase [Treponema sp.]
MKWYFRILLIVIAALFFNLAHPNVLIEDGISFFAFISLIPIFIVIKYSKIPFSFFLGLLYGSLSYGFLFSWIGTYSSYAMIIGVIAFSLLFGLLFIALKTADLLFKDKSFYIMALLWCIFEYLKTKGFLGFSYGILGYALWKSPLLIQCARIGGVWLLSALCVFTSMVLASTADRIFTAFKKPDYDSSKKFFTTITVLKKQSFLFLFLILSFIAVILYGIHSVNRGQGPVRKIPVLCVQNNTDSNKYGMDVYKKDVSTLISLTQEGLKNHPETAIVIWPETAVVPPIEMHYSNGTEDDRYEMIERLLLFINKTGKCFVIGNQRSVDNGGPYSDDYNSCLVFDSSLDNVIPPEPLVYAKNHLVPFTEYFPYEKAFPGLYEKLLEGDTHLWTPGTEKTVFNLRNIKFSTPICFEDSFGDLCRSFVKNGAECLFNLSNDSWSAKRFCQKQHLSMAVFRSVENEVPSARSTASGVTCFIDSKGRINNEAEQFCETTAFYNIEIPMQKKQTVYTRFGDWIPILEIILLFITVLFTILTLMIKKIRICCSKPVEKKGKKEVK